MLTIPYTDHSIEPSILQEGPLEAVALMGRRNPTWCRLEQMRSAWSNQAEGGIDGKRSQFMREEIDLTPHVGVLSHTAYGILTSGVSLNAKAFIPATVNNTDFKWQPTDCRKVEAICWNQLPMSK